MELNESQDLKCFCKFNLLFHKNNNLLSYPFFPLNYFQLLLAHNVANANLGRSQTNHITREN